MEEWKKVKVSNLGHIVTGKTPKTSDMGNYGGNIPFLTPSDDMSVKYVRSTNKTLTEKGLNEVRNCLLPPNAVCVSCIGSDLGKVVMTSKPTVTNQQINSIIVDNDCFDSDFIYYSMGILGKELNYISKTSTAVPIVNKSTFSSYVILCPTLETQKRIASILNRIDDKIEINRRINDNLQKQARALYKSWFVDFEPFDKRMPDLWKIGKLKDVLCLRKEVLKAGERTNLCYLPIDTIPVNTFALTATRPSEEAQSSLLAFYRDDIIIGAMRVYFHRVIIAPFDGITRSTCFVLTPKDPNYLAFGLLCCDQDKSIDFAQQSSKGSTMPYAVWDGGLGELEIAIPPQDIAFEFNRIIMPMIREIQKSYYETEILNNIRDTLLPKLMSGEIDVSDVQL